MLELDGAEGVREWRIHVQELDIEGVGARVGGALVRMSDGMIQGLMLELSGAKGVCEWMIHVQGLDIGGVGVRVGALIEIEEDERGTAGKELRHPGPLLTSDREQGDPLERKGETRSGGVGTMTSIEYPFCARLSAASSAR